nr:thioredoxin-disulfide reductase [Desulfobacterales bacterium]
MDSADYDLVIIGGGPAGLTAGLYAVRSRLDVLLVEKVVLGGQIINSDLIENYPGFPEGISGYDLVQKMIEQVNRLELPTENTEVISLDLSAPIKKIRLEGDKTISAIAIIIATGASPLKLGVPGEDILYGKGVSFCATCDGPFYRDRSVAVVGGGDTAVQEAIYLTKFAKNVFLIHRRDQLRASRILQERAFGNHKISFIWDSVVTRIHGEDSLEKLTIKNVKTGEVSELSVSGLFVFIGTRPNTDFLDEQLSMDERGFIIVNRSMETSVPGVYAAGDVRNTPLRQVVTAAGDGAIAAFSAQHYIDKVSI